jgi:hypothetical protein
MRVNRRLLAALVTGAGMSVILAAPAAAGAQHTIRVSDAAEAWYTYSPASPCASPLGCPPAKAPTSPYPPHTLHVGETAGQETARTYLDPNLAAVPPTVVPVTGSMTLPVSTNGRAGNVDVAAAAIEACLVTQPITDGVDGAGGKPPADTCRVHAAARYHRRRNDFTVNLTPFIRAWTGGQLQFGIVLLPAHGQSRLSAWHVAFNGRQLKHVRHIVSVLRVRTVSPATAAIGPPAPPPAAPVAPAPAAPAAPSGSAPAPAGSSGQLPSAGAAVSPGSTKGAPPLVAGNPKSRPRAAAFTGSGGFQYPEILLLPLALLAGLAGAGRLLTSDATPRRLS